MYGGRNSAAPTTRSGVRPTSTRGGGSGGSGSIVRLPAVDRSGKDHALVSTQPTKASSSSVISRHRSEGTSGTNNVAGQHRPSLEPPLQAAVEELVVVTQNSSSPPSSPAENHDTADDTVKTEEILLASSVMVDDGSDGEGGAARVVVTGGWGNRKDRASRPSAQSGHSATSSKGSGRYDKRARRAVDKDVVVLDPEDQGASADAGTNDTSIGARVAIKAASDADTEPAGSARDE